MGLKVWFFFGLKPPLSSSGSTVLAQLPTLTELGAGVAFWFFSATGKELGLSTPMRRGWVV